MTTDDPVLRATMESGEVWDDPSEDLLFMLLEDITSGPDTFVIVERTGDPTGQTYVQALRQENGTYLVEYRDGGPERHWATEAADLRSAHQLLAGWAFELPGWETRATWSRQTF